MHPIRTFFHEFEWIHVGLGLVGNLSFLLGSVVVKYAREDPDVHVDA